MLELLVALLDPAPWVLVVSELEVLEPVGSVLDDAVVESDPEAVELSDADASDGGTTAP